MSPAPMPAAPGCSTAQPAAPSQREAPPPAQAPPPSSSPPNPKLSFRAERGICFCCYDPSTRSSLATSRRAGRQQKRNDIFEIFLGKRFRVIGRHQRLARLLVRTKFRFLE